MHATEEIDPSHIYVGCVWMEGLGGEGRGVYFSFLNYEHYEMFFLKS